MKYVLAYNRAETLTGTERIARITSMKSKNLWGWGGFVTQKIKPCRLVARMIALIYNWWSLFVRLAEPDKHLEAIVSRHLLLHGVGKQTNKSCVPEDPGNHQHTWQRIVC